MIIFAQRILISREKAGDFAGESFWNWVLGRLDFWSTARSAHWDYGNHRRTQRTQREGGLSGGKTRANKIAHATGTMPTVSPTTVGYYEPHNSPPMMGGTRNTPFAWNPDVWGAYFDDRGYVLAADWYSGVYVLKFPGTLDTTGK